MMMTITITMRMVEVDVDGEELPVQEGFALRLRGRVSPRTGVDRSRESDTTTARNDHRVAIVVVLVVLLLLVVVVVDWQTNHKKLPY